MIFITVFSKRTPCPKIINLAFCSNFSLNFQGTSIVNAMITFGLPVQKLLFLLKIHKKQKHLCFKPCQISHCSLNSVYSHGKELLKNKIQRNSIFSTIFNSTILVIILYYY